MDALKKKRRLPVLIFAVLAATALLFSSGCRKEESFQAPPAPTVVVSTPTVKTVTLWAEYTGNTQAYAYVEIRARVQGFLQKMYFTPSTRVKKGDPLFLIEPEPYEAQLDQARATLATNRANLNLAKTTLMRKENALKDQAISEMEVLEAQADRDKAAVSIMSGEAGVREAKINLGYTKISSPIEGKVSRNLVDVGNLVGSGGNTLLTTVVDDDPIYVYFSISEKDLLRFMRMNKARAGQEPDEEENLVQMGMAIDGGYPYSGKIDYVDNQVDAGTGTITVRGRFENPDGEIIPGLFARVRIPVETLKDALLVPEAALGSDQQGRYLLVVNAAGEVEHRTVTLGPLEGDMRAILKGIKADDRVIVKGIQRVRPGVKANAMTAEEAEAAKKAREAQQKQAATTKKEA